MSTAVIGATGRVGRGIVPGVLARGDAVAALVRDPDKARRAFGHPDGLHIRSTQRADSSDAPATVSGELHESAWHSGGRRFEPG